jgi:nicotinate-nucleotide pyrophosphorylase (carboxylating)
MLDNFDPIPMKEIAQHLKTKFPHVLVEVSGGITLENLSQYFSPFVDIISMGSLTQGVPHIDFSLKIPYRTQ